MYMASNEDIPIRLKKVILNERYLGCDDKTTQRVFSPSKTDCE